MDAVGISKLADYGVLGILFLATLYTLKIVAYRYSEVLVNGRIEARGDLSEERKARQAHEQQMAQLLGELVKQSTEQKEAMDRMYSALAELLNEIKRLKAVT